MKHGYIPKEHRKKILMLSDDFRLPSGVGVMSKEIMLGTAHVFNWFQIGGAIKHPEFGKVLDASESVNTEMGLTDSYVRVLPYNGYGDQNIVRQVISNEKPDAILIFTDPRYWVWLFQMEHEIRETMPILYYSVWDDLPYPKYNENYYRSCDALFAISKQTHNIHKQLLKDDSVVVNTDTIDDTFETTDKINISYIPHGIDDTIFKKLSSTDDMIRLDATKTKLFSDDEVDFVVMYNSRNIRRKSTSDIILAFRDFIRELPENKREKCRLLLHTQPIDENGTDLITVLRDVAPDVKCVFSANRLESSQLNDLYNIADVVINIASAEGFGLGTLEALMSETMIIANVTGGLQDQMGFRDDDNNLLHEDIHFREEWGSNHDGKYQTHGEWVVPVYPAALSLVGSPPTPYIFDDRCNYKDATKALHEVYNMGQEERSRRGKMGREFAHDMGMTNVIMADRFINAITTNINTWIPRPRFELIKG